MRTFWKYRRWPVEEYYNCHQQKETVHSGFRELELYKFIISYTYKFYNINQLLSYTKLCFLLILPFLLFTKCSLGNNLLSTSNFNLFNVYGEKSFISNHRQRVFEALKLNIWITIISHFTICWKIWFEKLSQKPRSIWFDIGFDWKAMYFLTFASVIEPVNTPIQYLTIVFKESSHPSPCHKPCYFVLEQKDLSTIVLLIMFQIIILYDYFPDNGLILYNQWYSLTKIIISYLLTKWIIDHEWNFLIYMRFTKFSAKWMCHPILSISSMPLFDRFQAENNADKFWNTLFS